MNLRKLYYGFLKSLAERGASQNFHHLYKQMITINPELGKPAKGEKEWLRKWKRLDAQLKPYAYRIFSRYIGPDVNIVPLEVLQNVFEPVLNPILAEYYSDKNMAGKILSKEVYHKSVPHIFLRNIRGQFMDEDYKSHSSW